MSIIVFILCRVFVFSSSLNSSRKENFISLKIRTSEKVAPSAPHNVAIKRFCGWEIIRKPTANGAENPNEIKIPPKKIPM